MRVSYTGRGAGLVLACGLLATLYACAVEASEPDPSRPWEICIPVTTSQAAAYAAANPPMFQGTRTTPPVWIGARDRAAIEADRRRRAARRVVVEDVEPPADPPPPIPLPAGVWLLLTAVGALWAARRWAR